MDTGLLRRVSCLITVIPWRRSSGCSLDRRSGTVFTIRSVRCNYAQHKTNLAEVDLVQAAERCAGAGDSWGVAGARDDGN